MTSFSQTLETVAKYASEIGIIIATGIAIFSIFKWVIPMILAIRTHVRLTKEMAKEFHPNGGSSIKDALNRIEGDMNFLKEQVTKTSSQQWALVATQKDPVFESDAEGQCVRINAQLSNLTQRSIEEFRGNGWENIIYPDDLPRVTTEWKSAIEKNRAFESDFRIRAAITGKVYEVKCIATPYHNHNGEILGYVGRYVSVKESNVLQFAS